MNNLTKIMSNKLIVIATTLILTLAYIGLITVYAKGVSSTLNEDGNSYGRNTHRNITDLVKQASPEKKQHLKHELERHLEQTYLVINIIKQQEDTPKKEAMN